MKIHYLGTGSGGGIPAIFCSCDVCRTAREKGGENIRTRQQIMLDGILPVDFPADSYYHIRKYGYNGSDIKNVLITSADYMDFYPTEFANRYTNHAHDVPYKALTVCGSPAVSTAYAFDGGKAAMKVGRVELSVMNANETCDLDGYTVTPLEANEGVFSYSVSKEGKHILIIKNTLSDGSIAWLKESRVSYSLVSYACPLAEAVRLRATLAANGNADNNTVSIITALSHNDGFFDHAEAKAVCEKQGFTVAYDGMLAEV